MDMGAESNIVLSDIGANASAEEAEEGVEDTTVKVNNIVHSFRYSSTQFDKKSYLTYLKGAFREDHHTGPALQKCSQTNTMKYRLHEGRQGRPPGCRQGRG